MKTLPEGIPSPAGMLEAMPSDTRSRTDLHADGLVEVVVEIPRGGRNKYEQDDDGVIWFDRRIGGPAGFPGEYGYVVGIDAEDGDALDALVLCDEATYPGVHMIARVLGGFELRIGEDTETKILSVPESDHHQDHLRTLSDLPDNALEELDSFFVAYRMLEPGEMEVLRHLERDEVLRDWLS
ncbi:inorganic diphosphatase [Nocardioides euryhalodurans]|uniref:inorganic diphosphatase n=1 Tax=Nocardioides euryhalodurans TaxID=2518370 RepID=A0A4V1BDI3_9ACTN|nr:inorganic diphosphatase [Nocardioides euryhalodurans]QBR91222.1 inorganic diphosphatase [Nocardioides euryhalodurans]